MMKKTITILSVLAFGASIFALKSCSNNTEGSYGDKKLGDGAACLVPEFWFPHSQTPEPAEGANSGFANPATTSNCDFHLWSWQKFLYLTRTAGNGKLNFENLVQVDNQMKEIGSTLILDDESQAGSAAALFDKANRPIYYGIHLNQQMFDFSKKYVSLFKDCVQGDTLNPVLMTQHGYDTLTFPVGCFEVKTSWISTETLAADSVNYYITNALVRGTPARVALLGMHIIGRVINHPEFIWATYEHSNLAPLIQWPANGQPDSTTAIASTPSLFYNAGDPMHAMGIRRSHSDTIGASRVFMSTYKLFDHGTQPKYPGMILEQQDSANLANITLLNQGVFDKLSQESGPWKNYAYQGSVWMDPTVQVLTPGNDSIGSLNSNYLRGSRAISNITMETYAQLEFNFPNTTPPPVNNGATVPTNSMNCFGCHFSQNFHIGVNGAPYNLAMSHLFNNNIADTLKAMAMKPKK